MASNSNKIKSDQLGMSGGKAQHKLRKMILFMLVQETGRDKCFKCGGLIESVDELSIEHKQPWLHVSPELFWDLDNIAFSHLRCNTPDRPYLTSQAHIGNLYSLKHKDDGTAWCGGCKSYKSIVEFHLNARQPHGVHTQCKDCRSNIRKTLRASVSG